MEDKPYTRTTVYIRNDLYARLREMNFNFSAWVNNCLEGMLNGSNTELMELLNEERQHRARIAEIKQKIAMIQDTIPAKQEAEAQHEHEEKKKVERRDELARGITSIKPDFFIGKKQFDKFSTKELEGTLKKLAGAPQ